MLHRRLVCSATLVTLSLAQVTHAAGAPATKQTPPGPASPRISSTVEVETSGHLTDEESIEVSFAAGRVLKHVAQARESVLENKLDAAASHIDQSLKLISIINGVLPHHTVKTEIKSGEVTYSDEDEVVPSYVPIFEELERRDIVSPVFTAKNEVPKDSGHILHSHHAAHPMAVTHADVDYTAFKLNIPFAQRLLLVAKKDLQSKEPAQADAALRMIQSQGVLFEYEEVDLPLAQAADNLRLAEIEMKEGRSSEARAALQMAVDELKRYEEIAGSHGGAEIKTLYEEIGTLTTELDKGTPSDADRAKHSATISNWWHRVASMFTRKFK